MDNKGTPIYEIHVYEEPWVLNKHGFYDYGIDECVGYYYEKETALKAVKENWCDIQDHYAHAALVIEKMPGLYPFTPRQKCWYFIWNPIKECFEEAEFPSKCWT